MTKLEPLNRKVLELEHNGDLDEEEYATYKMLLEAVEHLQGILMWAEQKYVVLGCPDNHEQALETLEKLK